MAEEVEIIEEDFTLGNKEGVRGLIFKHLDRMSQFIFKGEGVSKDEDGDKTVMKTDKRITFNNAVCYLVSILTGKYDKEMTKAQEAFEANRIKTEQNLVNWAISSEAYEKGGSEHYLKWKEFLTKQKITPIKRGSAYYESYMQELNNCYNKLFTDLNLLLGRLNYLEAQAYTDG